MTGPDGCSVSRHVFQPLYNKSVWLEPVTPTKRLIMAVSVISGVYPVQYSVLLTDDVPNLEVEVTRPEPLDNLKLLHFK